MCSFWWNRRRVERRHPSPLTPQPPPAPLHIAVTVHTEITSEPVLPDILEESEGPESSDSHPEVEVEVAVTVTGSSPQAADAAAASDSDSHGSLTPPRRRRHSYPASSQPPPPFTTSSRFSLMSLPRGNYDPRRVCLNPFPEFTLGKHRRTVGVYLAGALVRRQSRSYTKT